MLGEHALWQKFVFYESSVGVPLIVRAPGVTAAGGKCVTPVSHVQLAPTLAELCGVKPVADSDGESLVPLLREPARTVAAPVHAHYDLGTPKPKAMVRRGDWKYCHYTDDTPELFNLRDDPQEMRNLAVSPAWRGQRDELRSLIIGL
jgi:choline-sulfatase